MKTTINRLIAIIALSLVSLTANAAPVNQLGFALDASGSVSATNYDLLRTGLNSAIAGLPVDGSVEITVVTFASGSSTVVAPTILTAASLPDIQNSITTHTKTGGGTNTAGAIDRLTAELTGSVNFADPGSSAHINLATDGFANSQSAAETSSQNSAAAGVDSLSVEAIGGGINSPGGLANMLALAFPGPATILAENETNIPDPTNGSWVVPVSDFSAYADVVNAKVQAIVNNPNPVPAPGTVAIFALGLISLCASRRGLTA